MPASNAGSLITDSLKPAPNGRVQSNFGPLPSAPVGADDLGTNSDHLEVHLAEQTMLPQILFEVHGLAERVDRLAALTPTVAPTEMIVELKSNLLEISNLLHGLPDRLADALTTALKTQHRLIINDIRSLLEGYRQANA